jgi:DNA-binding MarR family transcriptional regulator
MLAPLIRELIAAELPVLEANGLSMWGYSVLLAITKEGRKVKDATQTSIQRGEERWLSTLSDTDRATFLRILQELSGVDWS